MINPGNSQQEKEMDNVVAPEQLEASQEQQQVLAATPNNAAEQATPEDNQDALALSATRGKKRVKKERIPTEAELMPHPSIWPILLALSIAVALGGFAFNLIILGVGVIMVLVSVIGWNLQRK